jgi:hypothetical protein
MDQHHIAQTSAFAPEAPANEPASPANEPDDLVFATEAEEEAYWKGLTHGIRTAGREPAHPHMPADFSLDLTRDRAVAPLVSGKLLEAAPLDDEIGPAASAAQPRHDGFTPDKRRIFLATLAATGVVADACRMAQVSRMAAYNLRHRAEGRAFARLWDAALLIARGRLADDVHSRAMCGVIDRVYRNGELVAERHRYDNRLTMAVLTRLDRYAESLDEFAADARAIGGKWEEALALVDAGGDRLDALLQAPRGGETEADGMCKLRKADADEPAQIEKDEFDGTDVWEDPDGSWWTSFPPPEDFDGEEEGEPGAWDYKRMLSEAEQAVIDADEAEECAEELARESARRDRYFGFTGNEVLRPSEPELYETSAASPEDGDAEAQASSAPPGPAPAALGDLVAIAPLAGEGVAVEGELDPAPIPGAAPL